jgi:probable phosphoglycerate mutase
LKRSKPKARTALAWRKRVPDWAPGGGESLMQLRERITTTLHALAAQHLGGQIVLVAHGGVLDVLYRAATRQDMQAPAHLAPGQRGHQPPALDARRPHPGGLGRHAATWTRNVRDENHA